MNKLKVLISAFVLLLCFNSYAQELPKFGEFVKKYDGLSGYCKFAKYTMDSFIPTGRLGSHCDANFERRISSSSVLSYLTDADKSALLDYYKSIGYLESVYLSDLEFGIGFGKNSSGETCAYAGCFFYNVAYNTNRMSEEERAKDAIESAIIPILQKTGEHITKISHQYIMIGMGYLTKNPAESSENGAAVYCIIPIKDIIEFNALEITSKELIGKSRIYLKDVGDLKLITL